MRLKIKMPVAGLDAPSLDRTLVLNYNSFTVQCDRWADVPRYAEEAVANVPIVSRTSLNHEMFLAVRDELRKGQVQKVSARRRILRRNRLVAEVEAQFSFARFADDTRQDQCGVEKTKIRKKAAVTEVP